MFTSFKLIVISSVATVVLGLAGSTWVLYRQNIAKERENIVLNQRLSEAEFALSTLTSQAKVLNEKMTVLNERFKDAETKLQARSQRNAVGVGKRDEAINSIGSSLEEITR